MVSLNFFVQVGKLFLIRLVLNIIDFYISYPVSSITLTGFDSLKRALNTCRIF